MVFAQVSSQQIRQDLDPARHPLHVCVLEESLADLRALLAAPKALDLYQQSSWGSALIIAVWIDRLPAVEALLEAGMDPFAEDQVYDLEWTPLTLSAALGRRDILQLLLSRARVENVVRTEESSDPCCLIRASAFGQIPILTDLLEWHASWPQSILESGLMAAAMMWQASSIRLLLELTSYENSFLERTLFHAIDDSNRYHARGFKQLPLDASAFVNQQEVMALLINAGAEPNSTPWELGHLVPHAARTLNSTTALQTLLARGADPDGTSPWGLTALHILGMPVKVHGIYHETLLHETGIRLLLDHGGSVSKRGPFGDTALHTAAYGSRPDILCLYLASCCRSRAEEDILIRGPSSVSDRGDTLLHFAAAGSNVAMTEFLLARGLDVNTRNNDGWPPLICGLLRAYRSYIGPTHSGDHTWGSSVKVAQLLLAHGANPAFTAPEGWTPLHCLASHFDNGRDEIGRRLAENLIDGGVAISARAPIVTDGFHPWRCIPEKPTKEEALQGSKTSRGQTVVHWAARFGALGVVQALVARGVAHVPLEPGEDSPARVAAESKLSFRKPEVAKEICDLLVEAGYGF